MVKEHEKGKFLIVTTVPGSLHFFKGQIGELKKGFDIELVSSPSEKLDYYCELEEVEGYGVAMAREISPINDIKSLIKLVKLFKKLKPKVVHGNTPKGALLSMTASWISRVPHRIYCVHGLRYQGDSGIKRKMLMFIERLTCKMATDIFSVSYGVKELLKIDKITSKNINLIWNGSINGIDIDYFSPNAVDDTGLRKKHGLNSNNFVFGYVGRIVKDKGINELVEAFVEINNKYKNTKLLLVGGFEDLDPISSKNENEIETNKNIIYAGFQRDIRPYLKMMDVFTFPSYREGFGISLMEAAAMNVPAISTNITGCNEIIDDGYNGILIKSKSTVELKNAMNDLVTNKDKIKEMSKVSRQYVIDRYEQKKLWEKSLEAYTNIIY
ncbi:MAG: glycosyltransferase family 4 protein [Flavobacteriaceae bacterium]|nr:glycosyltransferase family 4 protein [Flavobacteriaceae bacterium]